MLLAACPMVLKFYDFYLIYFMALILAQNLISLYVLPQIFEITTEHLPGMDRYSARIRAILLLLGVLNILCFVASFSDHLYLGGQCDPERVIPYLMDIMIAMQIFAHFVIFFEHMCGYGGQDLSQCANKSEQSEIVK